MCVVTKLELGGTYLKLEPAEGWFEVLMLQCGCSWSNFSYSSGGNAIAPESRLLFQREIALAGQLW